MTEQDFTDNYIKHRPALLIFLVGSGYAHDVAEDAIQNTFLHLLPMVDNLHEKNFLSFLKQRTQWAANDTIHKDALDFAVSLEGIPEPIIPSLQDRLDNRTDVEKAIAKLKPELRPLTEILFERKTIAEMVVMTGFTKSKIEHELVKIKRFLAEELEAYRDDCGAPNTRTVGVPKRHSDEWYSSDDAENDYNTDTWNNYEDGLFDKRGGV
jgi:DNA-directed RNA polymerase specialized sigma24 family protein